ncbi:ABC transporter ATP-binding protein [Cohnella laeviribosi]|uniref:ABC transporter ATP-binding protein n=1 Tax=Cohnella laeviribosi TaxID=380174 RepID=UPI00036124B9|nr:ABC transporter ATP-binding protein [Cohnella laeviribosi]
MSGLQVQAEERAGTQPGGTGGSGSRLSVRPAILSVRGLTYGFSRAEPLFAGLDFDVREGEFVSFVMPSGMGKTTLFRLLAGLLAPQAGTIAVGEERAAAAEASRLGHIGYMPQRDSLLPWRTVLDNAALGLELRGTPKREARHRALELLPVFGLEGTERKHPHELSGGMRQRVSFLRATLGGGKLLLLDEPFSALDAMTRAGMQEWLLQIWERHRKTILFITHDVDEALLLSDRVLAASASPVSAFSEIAVDLPRPRDCGAVLEERFIRMKRELLRLLGRETRGSGGDRR